MNPQRSCPTAAERSLYVANFLADPMNGFELYTESDTEAAGPSDPESSERATDAPPTTNTTPAPTFPPGQGSAGFVPLGTMGVANTAQGNAAGVANELRGKIVVAERDAFLQSSPARQQMTYSQIHRKYPQWGVSVHRLRGLARNTRLDKNERSRIVCWSLTAVSTFP